MSVALGRGGVFAPAISQAVGAGAADIVAADFNGDGRLDLATANATASTVSVLLGNGDGTFAAATTVAVGAAPSGLVAADFNKDNRVDLVTANRTANTVSVLLGAGNGTFAAATSFAAGTSPSAVAAGKLNSDNVPDLAVTNGVSTGTVSVLIANGAGGFAAPTPVATGASPAAVVVADLDSDGRGDLVVANNGGSSTSLLHNTGNVTFSATTLAVGTGPRDVAVADVNGDYLLDLVTSNRNTGGPDGTLSVLLANTTGGYAAAITVPVGTDPYGVVVADFDSDGRPNDLAATNSAGSVSVVIGNRPGEYASYTSQTAGGIPSLADTADFNNDGRPDLVTTINDKLSVLLNDGNGGFEPARTFVPGGFTVAAADVDVDGRADLVVSAGFENAFKVLLGNGDGTFVVTSTLTLPFRGNYLAAGDFNGDGKIDFATTGSGSGIPAGLCLLLGNGDGTFRVGPTYAVGAASLSVGVGDFNGDGRLDAATANYTGGNVSVLLGQGDGTFVAAPTIVMGGNPYDVRVGDFDEDGRADLAVVTAAGTPGLAVLRGLGNGTFAAPVRYAAGASPYYAATGDFDGDGHTDLAVQTATSGTLYLLAGDGRGAFTTTAVATGGSTKGQPVVADFNGDGRPDLAGGNSSGSGGNRVWTLLNRRRWVGMLIGDGTVTVVGAGPGDAVTVSMVDGNVSIVSGTSTGQYVAELFPQLILSGVAATVVSDLGPATTLTVLANASATLAVTQHLAKLNVVGRVTVAAGGNRLLRVNQLVVGSGSIDLNDNALIYDYAAAATGQASAVRSLIATGRAGGAWTGHGLTSTTAKTNAAANTGLGYLEASDYHAMHGAATTFAGETVDNTAVLVRYTLYGDTDLDRGVSINDFNHLAGNFGVATNKTWFDGDADYDGGVSINDFNLLAGNFGKTLSIAALRPQLRKVIARVKH